MKTLAGIVIILLFQRQLNGAETSIPSPDRRFVAIISQKSELEDPILTIRTSIGDVLFTFKPDNIFEMRAGHALWSPDSKLFAFAGGATSKLLESYILTHENGRFVCVKIPYIPGKYDNAQILPLRWIQGNRLILVMSGPHAGHTHSWFRGKATVRLEGSPPKCEVLYQYINSGTYEDDK